MGYDRARRRPRIAADRACAATFRALGKPSEAPRPFAKARPPPLNSKFPTGGIVGGSWGG
eukprot:8161683-Pyramimonas_sp.AAC.1